MSSTSRRPYLIRAMHEWICDNDLTPHIVIDAGIEGASVPVEHVTDGKIILNIGSRAADTLYLGNETISFSARFNGSVRSISVPCSAVLGIYARETGEGMIFTDDMPDGDPDDKNGPDDGNSPTDPVRPTLKVVR